MKAAFFLLLLAAGLCILGGVAATYSGVAMAAGIYVAAIIVIGLACGAYLQG